MATDWEDEWEADEEEAPALGGDGASHGWSWESIERDLARLSVASRVAGDVIVDAPGDEEAERLAKMLRLAEDAAGAVDAARDRLATLDALALATKAQLLAAQAAFPAELQAHGEGGGEDASAVIERLRASAGRWGVRRITRHLVR